METKDYLEKINLNNKKIEKIKRRLLDNLYKENSLLKEKMYKNIIDKKEYIADLSKYNGKEISFIALDSNGKNVWLPTDEIVEVRNGKLYLSSYEGGIVNYDDKLEKYVHSYHYRAQTLDIVGFINIEVIE